MPFLIRVLVRGDLIGCYDVPFVFSGDNVTAVFKDDLLLLRWLEVGSGAMGLLVVTRVELLHTIISFNPIAMKLLVARVLAFLIPI